MTQDCINSILVSFHWIRPFINVRFCFTAHFIFWSLFNLIVLLIICFYYYSYCFISCSEHFISLLSQCLLLVLKCLIQNSAVNKLVTLFEMFQLLQLIILLRPRVSNMLYCFSPLLFSNKLLMESLFLCIPYISFLSDMICWSKSF